MISNKMVIELSVFNRLKAIIEERGLAINIFEGEVSTISESGESANMISVLFEYPENIEFGALVAQTINEEYNLC